MLLPTGPEVWALSRPVPATTARWIFLALTGAMCVPACAASMRRSSTAGAVSVVTSGTAVSQERRLSGTDNVQNLRTTVPLPNASLTSSPTLAIGTTLERLRAHEVVTGMLETPGTSLRTGYAATIVHRPVSRVLAVIHDVDRYRELVPQFEQSRELRRTAASQDVFVRLSIASLAHIWARVRYRDTSMPNGVVLIDGRALQGNVDRLDVRWRATPIDGGAATMLEFWSLVVPSLPIPLPGAILDRAQEIVARRGVEAVRQQAERAPVR